MHTLPDDPADAAAMAAAAAALADGIDAILAGWVVRMVDERWQQWSGEPPPTEVLDAARDSGVRAQQELSPQVRALLETDVDEQTSNPLAILRRAVDFPTAVLRGAGVPPVERDDDAIRLFPADDYDLTPGSFADLDPSLTEPGLLWGAAKAHVVLARRRREGRR